MIGELLGIPAADRPRLHAWFEVLLTGWAGDPPQEAVEASDGIVAYLAELVDAKRQRPADDLVSVLVAAEDDTLTTQELLSSLFQLVVAGHDTITGDAGKDIIFGDHGIVTQTTLQAAEAAGTLRLVNPGGVKRIETTQDANGVSDVITPTGAVR